MKKKVFLLLVSILAGTASLSAFDRGLGDPKSVYIPKGTVAASLTGGYNSWNATGESNTQGVNLAGLITDVNGQVTFYNVNAGLSWFVRDNLSIGARFGYGNTIVDDNSLSLMGLVNLTNKHVRRETYTAALAVRGYMPLFDSRVFALFFEGRLSGSLGYNKSYEVTERGKEGSYSDLYTAALGLYPGASVFVTDRVAFEVSLPIVEGVLEWDKQIKGQAHDSALTRRSVNFKPGLLGLRLGIVFHF